MRFVCKNWIVSAGILFFLLSVTALADQGPDDIECLPEGHSLIDIPGAEVVHKGIYTISRKQVLMEEATATW